MRVGGDWTGVHRKTHRDAEPSRLNLNVLMEHEETVETALLSDGKADETID